MSLRVRLTIQKSGFFALELWMGSALSERTSKKCTCMLSFSQPRQRICLHTTKIHQECCIDIETDITMSPVRKHYDILENMHRHRKHPIHRIICFPLNKVKMSNFCYPEWAHFINIMLKFYFTTARGNWPCSPGPCLQHCWFSSGDAGALLKRWHCPFLYCQWRLACNHQN